MTGDDPKAPDQAAEHNEDSARISDSFLNTRGALGGAVGTRLASMLSETERERDLAGQSVGSVRMIRKLGDGGFGRVYLGHDEKLDRRVAVKVLHATRSFHQRARDRFRREARLLSKLDHPNICRIYGLIEEGGVDYLVLEYIDGQPLAVAAAGADAEAKLGLARDIAAALQAAHEANIIHRDLKPANVIVTPEGIAKVLDFGVARVEQRRPSGAGGQPPPSAHGGGPIDDGLRAAGDEGLTRLGSRLGTIRHMSPEQARGEELTLASDLFAFGLLLHELFGGRPAYPEEAPDGLLARVQKGEVEPLEHPDADLVALVRDLERYDPRLRPSASEAVETLKALLDRPRRRRKRRLKRLAVGASILSVLVLLAAWWRLRWEAASDIAASEALIAQAHKIEWRMRAEYLSPAHDIEGAKEAVRLQTAELKRTLRSLGRVAAGPGHYAIGRAALSVDDLATAREEVETAWALGYRTPEVANTLGRILARIFRDEVQRDSGRYTADQRNRRLAQHRVELGEPAARYLEMGRGTQVDAPAYVESLLAVSEGDYQEALEHLASIDLPWFYERYLLEGWIEDRLFQNELVAGSIEGLRDHVSRARSAYRVATAIGRSDPRAYAGLCRASSLMLNRGLLTGEESTTVMEEAERACQKALEISPGSEGALSILAATYFFAAQDAWDRGKDAAAFLEKAEKAAEEGLAANPESAGLQRTLVRVLWRKAVEIQQRGRDPTAAFARGREIAERLVAADLPAVADLQAFVLLVMDQAMHLESKGHASVQTLQRGIEVSERSIEIQASAAGWANLAIFHYLLGSYESDHGLDPGPSVRAGLEAIGKGVEQLPGHPAILRVLGNLNEVGLRHAVRTGGDGAGFLAKGRKAFEAAAEADPDFVWAKVDLLLLELVNARASVERGEAPRWWLANAARILRRLESADDVKADYYLLAGRGQIVEGMWAERRGASPVRAWERAESFLERAAGHNSLDAAAYAALAEARWLLARRSPRRTALVSGGLEAADRALKLKPDHAEALITRAGLLRLRAARRGESSADELLVAAAGAEAEACAINRFLRPQCAGALSPAPFAGAR